MGFGAGGRDVTFGGVRGLRWRSGGRLVYSEIAATAKRLDRERLDEAGADQETDGPCQSVPFNRTGVIGRRPTDF